MLPAQSGAVVLQFAVEAAAGHSPVGGTPDVHACAARRHFATWVDPVPKPSYLFCLVAGQLASLEVRCRLFDPLACFLSVMFNCRRFHMDWLPALLVCPFVVCALPPSLLVSKPPVSAGPARDAVRAHHSAACVGS